MILDAATQANLELVQARGGGARHAACSARSIARSRRWARGNCATGFCIRSAISPRCARASRSSATCSPSRSCSANLRETLKAIRDMERTVGRLTQTGGNARDLRRSAHLARANPAAARGSRSARAQARRSFRRNRSRSSNIASSAPARTRRRRASRLASPAPPYSRAICTRCPHLVDLLAKAIVDEPPALTQAKAACFATATSPRSTSCARRARGQGLDRAAPAARDRGDRDQVAESPLHLGLRLLHRGHEIESRRRARRRGIASRPWRTASASSRRS